jgi:hypothetical protein
MTQRIKLSFPNLQLLWKFAQTLSRNHLEIYTGNCSLICDCNEEDAERATREFEAIRAEAGPDSGPSA